MASNDETSSAIASTRVVGPPFPTSTSSKKDDTAFVQARKGDSKSDSRPGSALLQVKWHANVAYHVGDRVTFLGVAYECQQSHQSQEDWSPPDSIALWKACAPTEQENNGDDDDKPAILPYASELFGIYQPLIGWRSQLSHETLSKAVAKRVREAALHTNKLIKTEPLPRITPVGLRPVDRTGTQIGKAIAAHLSEHEDADANELLSGTLNSSFSEITGRVLGKMKREPMRATESASTTSDANVNTTAQSDHEIAMAAVLKYLNDKAPAAVQQIFRPSVLKLDRAVAGAGFFADNHPAKSVYLSPIGLLHQFREYFFQLGTFLGPPVGHVWISPGGTVELVEVNTRRQLVEQTMESSAETVNKSDLDRTDKDELSDAVKNENANDMRLGANASASGGFGPVFQASGTASFNLDMSRKQAQEQSHKRMREQSAKLSSEVRQNYRTTFRTMTETTDTSSRRYVLQNHTSRLVSYELSRKMRKVAVQVQDLGQRLCWQMYVNNPGDSLGTSEFVHATAAALDPRIKPPEEQPDPEPQVKVFSDAFPYIVRGGDKELEEDFYPDPDRPGIGIHVNSWAEADDRIQFVRTYDLPPAPTGYELSQVLLIDFHGAAVTWKEDLQLDMAKGQFTLHLDYANFGNRETLPFDATVEYLPDRTTRERIKKKNEESKAAYQDQVEAAKEKGFYDTLRARLKLLGGVRTRSQDDMRAEERSIIYRNLICRLYGTERGWKDDDYYAASEMIRYFFDIDTMLYFVAPDWWKPRTQQLAWTDKGRMTSAAMTQQPLSTRVALMGKASTQATGLRPYYLITEETEPARLGSSLGWLMQLDGDNHRNAFLNSPWVKAILPMRPGREREAIAFLERQEVAGSEGLDQPYPYKASVDPPEYQGRTLKGVLLQIADKIAAEYADSLKPVPVGDQNIQNPKVALPAETVFTQGYNPLEGGINFNPKAFTITSDWTEVLPTDQVVATEYNLTGL